MFIEINGIKTYYLTAGNPEKPPLLLLHGWGCEGNTYRRIIDRLTVSEKFHIIAPDLPGFGQTPEPNEPWGVSEYADFVRGFSEALNLHNITLFGHSLGCRIIIKLLAEGGFASANKVILTGAAGIKPRKTFPQKIRTAVFKTGKVFLKPFPKAFERLQGRSGSADYRAASPMMRKCLVKIVNEDLTPYLCKITQSVLLIWGENDDSTPLTDGCIMERIMPDAGLAVIKNAGHYAFFDDFELFMRIVGSYLSIGTGE